MSRTPCLLILCVVFMLCLLPGCLRKHSQEVRLLWPIPPDGPRFEFVGNFQSLTDLPGNHWYEPFTGKGSEPPVLQKPRGVFVRGDKVYVTDETLHNVMVFDLTAQTIEPFLADGVLRAPRDIVADRQGRFYIADGGSGQLLIVSAEGGLIKAFAGPEPLLRPAHLAVNDELQRIYVSDSARHCIVVFDLSGEWLFSFGSEGNGRGELLRPQGMAFDQDGRLFVADSGNARIQVFDAQGTYLSQFGERGNTVRNFREPVDLAFDSEGHLHVVDRGMFALLSYSLDGKLLLATGSGFRSRGRMGLARPAMIDIDANDRIFISDPVKRSVTCWQYLNHDYLRKNPIGAEDYAVLADYLGKTSKDRVAINQEDMHSALTALKGRMEQAAVTLTGK